MNNMTTMHFGTFLATCLIWADSAYASDSVCMSLGTCHSKPTLCRSYPCPDQSLPTDEIDKRSVVPRSLQALIGRMQEERPAFIGRMQEERPAFIGRVSGVRLRRLQPSEFLGKRAQYRTLQDTWSQPEGKRANELLGKRSDGGESSFQQDPRLEMNGRSISFPSRMRRGPRRKFNSGNEFLGKRADGMEVIDPEFPMKEPMTDEDSIDV